MSLKNNYIKLSKKFGGTHVLINKGLKRSIIDSIMRGSDISVSNAYEVAKILGVSVERLLTGEDRYHVLPEQRINEEEGYSVPLVDGYISGGMGSIPIEHIVEKFWIPKKYLRSPAGHDFRYVALKVNGYSMEPLLEEGDIVVIDRADCDLKKMHENSIYAVRKDDLYYIKHLHFEEKSKTLQLISASTHFVKKHGFEYINLKEIEENPIIGKVVFSLKKWN